MKTVLMSLIVYGVAPVMLACALVGISPQDLKLLILNNIF